MAWTLDELFSFVRECNPFTLILESAPWEQGAGKIQRLLCEQQPGEFPEQVVAASFAIAQEWANQLGEAVRLSVEGDHCRGEVPGGRGFWAVKEFRPVPDGRTPDPQLRPFRHTTAFWPLNCPFCKGLDYGVGSVAFFTLPCEGMKYFGGLIPALDERTAWRMLVPACSVHEVVDLKKKVEQAERVWEEWHKTHPDPFGTQ